VARTLFSLKTRSISLTHLLANVKRIAELLARDEELGEQVVEQGPKLGEVVLEGSSCENQGAAVVHFANSNGDLGLLVLDYVTLVENDELEVEALKHGGKGRILRHLVSRHDDVVAGGVGHDFLPRKFAGDQVGIVHYEEVEFRIPTLDLLGPRVENGKGADDEGRASLAVSDLLLKVGY